MSVEASEKGYSCLFTLEEVETLLGVIKTAGASEVSASGVKGDVVPISAIDLAAMASSVQGIMDPIGQVAQWIYERIKEAVQVFSATVTNSLKTLYDTLISPALTNLLTAATSAISAAASSIQSAVDAVRQRLESSLTSALSAISQLFRTLTDTLSTSLRSISVFLTTTLPSLISGMGDKIQDAVRGALSAVHSAIASLSSSVTSSLSSIHSLLTTSLPRLLSSVEERLTGALRSLADGVTKGFSFFGDALAKITGGLAALGEMLRGVGSVLTGFVNAVIRLPQLLAAEFGGFFQGIVDRLQAFVDAFVSFITDPLGALRAAFDWLASQLWNLMPEWLKESVRLLGRVLENLWSALQNFLRDPWGAVTRAFQELGKWIWEQMPAPIKGVLSWLGELVQKARDTLWSFFTQTLPGFFSWLWSEIEALRKSPVEWLQSRVVQPLVSAAQWLWQKIVEGAKWLWDQLSLFGTWLVQSVSSLLSSALGAVSSALLGAGQALVHTFQSVSMQAGQSLSKVGESVLDWGQAAVIQATARAPETTTKLIRTHVDELFKSAGVSSPQMLTPGELLAAIVKSLQVSVPMMLLGYGMMLPVRATVFGIRSLAAAIAGMGAESEVEAGAVGPAPTVRKRFRWSWTLAAAGVMFRVAREISKMTERYTRYSVQGLMLWYGQAMSKLITFQLRNHIPMAVPDYGELFEVINRSAAADVLPKVFEGKVENLIDYVRFYMAVNGYSDVTLSWRLALPEEFSLVVRDRFGVPRLWPLALYFNLPSATVVAEWFVRDLFYSVEDFYKVARARGLAEDVAAFYFFSTFKYPSPETLSRFYWRGVTGTLWLTAPMEDAALKAAFKINYKSSAPAELNFKMSLLQEIISRYLRWHDRSPVPWAPDFPTDRAITLELMADLPTTVDIAAMVRWGIFEHLSLLGFTLSTPSTQIPALMQKSTGAETLVDRITPEISLDATAVARLVESRGVHPDYVPAIAVALTHRVLTREMTLIRTGFLNLYRRGLSGLLTLEKLLSGLFVIKFKTGYYDPTAPSPEQAIKVFEYKKPLFWLPAERRLIEVRAVIDRADLLFRSLLSVSRRGVRNLVFTAEEVRKAVDSVYSMISTSFTESIKALTGRAVAPELDESYFSIWMAIEQLAADITKKQWIRRYASRMLPWALYRVAYGWIGLEEVRRLTELLVSRRWITQEEADFFVEVSGWMLDVLRREYTVSPSTLATLAEYVELPDRLVDLALQSAKMPPEVAALWKAYIKAKTVKSDYRRLLSAARRALRRGVITEDEYRQLVREAAAYGFTAREISIEERIADYEVKSTDQEVYPSLSTLVSLAEYVDVPLEYVAKIVQSRRLEETYAKLWLDYFRIRPVSSEVSALVSTYRSLAAQFAVPPELAQAVEGIMAQYGWTRVEMELFKRDLELRRALRTFTWLVPTVRQVVGDSLYMPNWQQVFDQVLSLRGVDVEKYRQLVDYYRQLAESRHVMRHLAWYRTQLAYAYADGVIDEVELRSRLQALKQYGLSDKEIELVVEGCRLLRARRLARAG